MQTSAPDHNERRFARYASFREEFLHNGAVLIPQALNATELSMWQHAFQWKLDTAGDKAMRFFDGRMIQALGGHGMADPFQKALRETAVGDVAAALFGGGPVWFLEEQIFYKEGRPGEGVRRTAWHQDGSFQPFDGVKNLVIWMSFDPLYLEEGLEIVRRSHKGTIYNGIVNDAEDDSKPFFSEECFPRVPDIEADRANWDISSWPHTPGDLVVFHARTLHGGEPCLPGRRRRSLALRFFGDDVLRIEHPAIHSVDTGTKPRGTPDARSVTEDGSYLTQFARVPIGEPIASIMDWTVRPWMSVNAAAG